MRCGNLTTWNSLHNMKLNWDHSNLRFPLLQSHYCHYLWWYMPIYFQVHSMSLVCFVVRRASKVFTLVWSCGKKVCLRNKISISWCSAQLLQGRVPVCQWKTTDLFSLNNTQLPAIPLSLFHVFLHTVMATQFATIFPWWYFISRIQLLHHTKKPGFSTVLIGIISLAIKCLTDLLLQSLHSVLSISHYHDCLPCSQLMSSFSFPSLLKHVLLHGEFTCG